MPLAFDLEDMSFIISFTASQDSAGFPRPCLDIIWNGIDRLKLQIDGDVEANFGDT